MIYGFHFSIAGPKGFLRALEEAQALGVKAVQIFAKSPRQWRKKALSPSEAERFRAVRESLAIEAVVIHASYLVNLGAKGELFEKSVFSLADDLEKARMLGADMVVVHPGSGSVENIRKGLFLAQRLAPSQAQLLVENTAGGGKRQGASLEALAEILDGTPFGLALDTAHAHLAGYPIEGLIDAVARRVGLDRLKLIHLNDTPHPLGSHRDVHASLGQGAIGEALATLVRDPRLANIPMISEVPPSTFEENLRTLKRWLGS